MTPTQTHRLCASYRAAANCGGAPGMAECRSRDGGGAAGNWRRFAYRGAISTTTVVPE